MAALFAAFILSPPRLAETGVQEKHEQQQRARTLVKESNAIDGQTPSSL